MKRFAIFILICFLGYFIYTQRSKDAILPQADPTVALEPLTQPKGNLLPPKENEQLENRLRQLQLKEENRRQKAELTLKSKSMQREILTSISCKLRWNKLLRNTYSQIKELTSQSLEKNSGKIDCSICEQTDFLDVCIACDGNNGICIECQGSRTFFGEPCPPCLGSGKCFLCAGTGRMECVFCKDGTFLTDQPLPPQNPVEVILPN